ncbi:MAG TPA: hypothetical protein VGE04_16060, partial [Chloroflexia bacterium]
ENGASDPDGAAAGWGGGSYAFYQNGDQSLMYTAVEWDDQSEADEYVAALEETFDNATKTGDLYEQDGRFFSLTTSGKTVTLISSNDQAALESVTR